MTAILKAMHKPEKNYECHTGQFTFYHPYLAFLAIAIQIPILILLAVAACTTLILFPIALIFGWL